MSEETKYLRAVAAVELLYSKWENGHNCYEDGDSDNGSYMGKAFSLDRDEEHEVLEVLQAAGINTILGPLKVERKVCE